MGRIPQSSTSRRKIKIFWIGVLAVRTTGTMACQFKPTCTAQIQRGRCITASSVAALPRPLQGSCWPAPFWLARSVQGSVAT